MAHKLETRSRHFFQYFVSFVSFVASPQFRLRSFSLWVTLLPFTLWGPSKSHSVAAVTFNCNWQCDFLRKSLGTGRSDCQIPQTCWEHKWCIFFPWIWLWKWGHLSVNTRWISSGNLDLRNVEWHRCLHNLAQTWDRVWEISLECLH